MHDEPVRRALGTTALRVSPWCLGCNLFGWTADEAQSFAILDAYVESGGNFLDTADSYPPGMDVSASEEILGRWLKRGSNREAVVLATKVGSPHRGASGLSAAAVSRRANGSLRRLGVDHVDLLYAHLDDDDVPLEETLGSFDELVRAGSVRYVGASNFTAARLEEALAVSRRGGLAAYAVLQPHYNLLERTQIVSSERASIARGPFEGELQDLCVREGVGVVPYWALARGFLTGKYRPGEAQDDGPEFSDRARLHTPRVYLDERGTAVLSELDALAATYDTNLAALALAWTVAQPGISSALASARTLEQVSQLAEMSRLRLSGEDIAALTLASA